MVRLVNFQIAVLGEVGSPGSFTIDKDQINIFQAIGLAGGFQSFSNIRKVKIVRQTLKGSEIVMVDLTKKDILQSDYFYLMPNDIVYVPPRGAKTWLYEKFPYGSIFGILSFGISMFTLFKVL
jgi:polysaccharide export outer membrane protein